ncbi:MAG: glycosyltransferase [Methanobacterium paludis]|jgi:glycosyltransferase involved in cell wall biosynthesis|nr:glycosyltransferase [Methanobacterium paludis]
MKILQVISSFPPAYAYGGALKIAYEVSKELVKEGHSVTVYTTDVYGYNSRLEFEENPILMDGIEVYHFKNLSNKLAHMNFPIAPSMAFALKKNINKFDVIHVHEYRSFQAILVHHYAKKFGVSYVVQSHGSVLPFFQKQKIKKVYDHFWGYKLLQDASNVIALTETESKQCQKMGVPKNKIAIVPNGINLLEYQNLPKRGEFKKKYKIKNEDKIILYLGRINKIKGIDLLINSFLEVSKKLDNVKLVIVGPDDGFLGYLKEMLKNLKLSSKIIFTGPLYEKDKLKAYIDADIYVLPSRYETFPNTVIESCACGTPVILTDRCGISDLIKDNVGYVVPYEKNSLRDALIEILENNELRETLSKKCSNFVQVNFNLKSVVNKFEEIYSYSKL